MKVNNVMLLVIEDDIIHTGVRVVRNFLGDRRPSPPPPSSRMRHLHGDIRRGGLQQFYAKFPANFTSW